MPAKSLSPPLIGIVGGVGPYAGLELNRKIFDNTVTDGTDQGHLEVLLFSAGRRVPDRTEYLLGDAHENPAGGLFETIRTLAAAGAAIVAIACNTAHSERIFGSLRERIKSEGLEISLVDMIEETGFFIRDNFIAQNLGQTLKVGILATEGTIRDGLYNRLENDEFGGIEVLLPSREIERLVHRAIYEKNYGIKACSNPVTERAHKDCRRAVEHFLGRKAKFVILGCTELPLALRPMSIQGIELIDPAEITARALISRAAPEKLKPL